MPAYRMTSAECLEFMQSSPMHEHQHLTRQGRKLNGYSAFPTRFQKLSKQMKKLTMQGPAFEVDARKPQGRIFIWIDRMFTSTSNLNLRASMATAGPSKAAVARLALMNLLSSNADVMEGCVDQCYVPNVTVARGFFQVIPLDPVSPCMPMPWMAVFNSAVCSK